MRQHLQPCQVAQIVQLLQDGTSAVYVQSEEGFGLGRVLLTSRQK